MHAAPSVSYPVGRSPFAGRLYALLAGAGLAVAAIWAADTASLGWRQALAFALALACGAAGLHAWLRSPRGVLRWDGLAWYWEDDGGSQAGELAIALDLQARLLLRWRGEGGAAHWLWLERKSDASHWDALRRAVYSRATQVSPAGPPPAAEQ